MNTTASKSLLLDEMRIILRREGYAFSTENSYCDWVKRFIKFNGFKDRDEMLLESSNKVEAFLNLFGG